MSEFRFDNLIVMVLFLTISLVSGIFAGVVYFQLNTLDSELRDINFDIPLAQNSTSGTVNVTQFQDVLGLVIYPILGLKNTLPYLVYFMMFGFIIALALTAYMTSKNPIFFVLHLLFTLLLTYFAIILSNTYQELLSNNFINNMMIDFTVYNIVMLYLPQIFFMTSLVFAGISFVNVMKPSTREHPYGLNYGGDY